MTPSLTNFLLSLLAGIVIVVVPATIGLFSLARKIKFNGLNIRISINQFSGYGKVTSDAIKP